MKPLLVRRLAGGAAVLALVVFLQLSARAEDPKTPAAAAGAAPDSLTVQDQNVQRNLMAALNELAAAKRTRTVPDLLKEEAPASLAPVLVEPATRDLAGPDLYRRLCESTLILGARYKCKKCSQWHLSTASGIVLTADGAVLTNWHVLGTEEREAIVAMDVHGKVYPVAALLARDTEHDLAVLRIEGAGLTPLPLAPEDAVPGTEVAVLSHPDNHYFLYTTGVVSRWAESARNHDLPAARPFTVLCITAPIAPGSSGGPVVDRRGNVVGVAEQISPIIRPKGEHQPEYAAMVIQMAVPVRWVRALLRPAAGPASGGGH